MTELIPLDKVENIEEAEPDISAESVEDIEEVDPLETEDEETTEEESTSKLKKMEPGVYQDEEGKYFRVTKDGELKKLDDESDG